jgi:hypothetical protein
MTLVAIDILFAYSSKVAFCSLLFVDGSSTHHIYMYMGSIQKTA